MTASDNIVDAGIQERINFGLTISNIYSELMRISEEFAPHDGDRKGDFELIVVAAALAAETYQGRKIRKASLAQSLRIPRTTLIRKLDYLKSLGFVSEDDRGGLTWHPTEQTKEKGDRMISALRACTVRLWQRDQSFFAVYDIEK